MERRLTVILAADVVGYSRLMGEDEAGTLEALQTHRKELIEPKAYQYIGRTIKLMGDGALMEFGSVVDAVSFALEVQLAMRERNAEVPEDQQIIFRIGINIGDVLVEGDDIYGDGVNIAARLENLAEPGEILVHRNVHNQVRDKLDIDFEDLREIEVKNIARPVPVFRLVLDDKAAALVTPVVKTPHRRRKFIAAGIVTRRLKHALHIVALTSILALPGRALAHEPHECPRGLPEQPTIPGHVEQDDIVAGAYTFEELLDIGQKLFIALFNTCDGQGRPETTGTVEARNPGQPAFIRTSSPDANSCAGCHNAPRAGGAGDFAANVFVLAHTLDPVANSIHPALSNERNTLGMFGSGAIDMLAREMTAELQGQVVGLRDGTHKLTTKGVEFEITIAGGRVIASKGVDSDLIVKPFHQAGVVRSVREFTVNAFNHHHGMQAEERFDLNTGIGMDEDFDNDGIVRELTIGDITATTLFQAALGVPGRLLPTDPAERREVDRGEQIFATIGCVSCHTPKMTLNSRHFVEPYKLNPDGTFSDDSQSFIFDMTKEGEKPRLERAKAGGAIVRAYTDLKRHNLCDPESDPDPIRFFCNEQLDQGRPDQDGRPGAEFFITRKLWDVGNSAPYGHRGDLTTISEAILAHGGEARTARNQFVALASKDQVALIKFLKTLQVLPAGSPLSRNVSEQKPRRPPPDNSQSCSASSDKLRLLPQSSCSILPPRFPNRQRAD